MIKRKSNYYEKKPYQKKMIFDHVQYLDHYDFEFFEFVFFFDRWTGIRVIANIKDGIRNHKRKWHKI